MKRFILFFLMNMLFSATVFAQHGSRCSDYEIYDEVMSTCVSILNAGSPREEAALLRSAVITEANPALVARNTLRCPPNYFYDEVMSTCVSVLNARLDANVPVQNWTHTPEAKTPIAAPKIVELGNP